MSAWDKEFKCKTCGKTIEVKISHELGFAMQSYEHCPGDEGRLLPPIIEVREKESAAAGGK